jgi:DNA repair exonuclease SbcCD nuclease subunit
MKLLSCSDWHVRASNPISRKDDYVETLFKKIQQLVDKAVELNCPIICAGDLLDGPTVPYWLLNRLIRVLQPAAVVAIIGNHETLQHNINHIQDTALWTLHEAEAIALPCLEYPGPLMYSWDGDNVSLACVHFGQAPQGPVKGYTNILVSHDSVFEDKVPFFMEGKAYTAAEYKEKYPGYDFYLCGDIHQPCNRGGVLVSGSMMRSNIIQKDYRPRFYEIDTVTKEVVTHYFEVEEDVWRDVLDVQATEGFSAELQGLTDVITERMEKPDYPSICIEMAGEEHKDDFRRIFDEYTG